MQLELEKEDLNNRVSLLEARLEAATFRESVLRKREAVIDELVAKKVEEELREARKKIVER